MCLSAVAWCRAAHPACGVTSLRAAWLYDSPSLYSDVWMVLGFAAAQTERIGLGPAVLVPNLRHPLTQASAIATLEQLAPGRAAVAIGTGFTGRMAMGKKALGWKGVREYVAQVRALLRGEPVEVDGAMVQMLHADAFAPARPIATPIVVAANGPKGLAVAEELGDGVMTIGSGNPDFEWCSVLAFGTVLDDGEDAGSARALAAAGPGLTVVFHGMYEGNPEAVDGLPGGAGVAGRVEQVPQELRHLAVHEDHLVAVTEHDRPLLDGALLRAFTWTERVPRCAPGSTRSKRRAERRSSTRRWVPTSPANSKPLRRWAACGEHDRRADGRGARRRRERLAPRVSGRGRPRRRGRRVRDVRRGRRDDPFLHLLRDEAVRRAAAWILIQEGRLEVSRPVADYIPEFASFGKDVVTVEQVMLHTAGFPNAFMRGDRRCRPGRARRRVRGVAARVGARDPVRVSRRVRALGARRTDRAARWLRLPRLRGAARVHAARTAARARDPARRAGGSSRRSSRRRMVRSSTRPWPH